jgi:biopolymer transport protein ExbB/TolQ
MTGFSLQEMMLNGWPIISVLLIMSIYSIAIMSDRILTLRRAHTNPRTFVASVIGIIDGEGVPKALEHCRKSQKPIAAVVAAVLAQPGKLERRKQALQNAVQEQINLLELRVPVLGTVASTAPFVGLLGTVIGIIKAFRDIAMNVGGGPEVVSAGIAEALITTAFGLFVAIPAVFGFNYCVNRVRKMAREMNLATYAVIERLSGDDE